MWRYWHRNPKNRSKRCRKSRSIADEDGDTHEEYSPEKKEFPERLERALAMITEHETRRFVDRWNQENPTMQITMADYIKAVNGFSDCQKMTEALLKQHIMHLTVGRSWKETQLLSCLPSIAAGFKS